jgi:hypothetical protein
MGTTKSVHPIIFFRIENGMTKISRSVLIEHTGFVGMLQRARSAAMQGIVFNVSGAHLVRSAESREEAVVIARDIYCT